jgi:outer membrane protein TolC
LKKIILFGLLYSFVWGDMSIQEAWQTIEINNDGMKAAKADEAIAKLKKDSAKSMYLPSISVSGSYTHLSDNIKIEDEFTGPITGNSYPIRIDLSEQDVFLANLHLLWPLYTGGKIDAAQDVYSAQSDEARALKEMKTDEKFLKLVKYYYGVVVSRSLYQTQLKSLDALEIHYENAKKLKEAGQIANIELLNAEVKLNSAKIETTKAKHKLEIALSALHSLVKKKFQPSSKLVVNGSNKEQNYYIQETRDNYAGLKILDAKEKQSAAVLSIKKAAWHPEVMAYGNYNLYKDNSILSQSMPNWMAGVVVKIDLLQRKDRGEEIEAAKLLNSKVKYLRAEAVDNLALLVEKTYKEMLLYQEEYFSLSASIALSEENYKLRKIAFKEGLSTSVSVVDAQMFLLGARTKRLNAAYNYIQKLSQLCVLSAQRDIFFELVNSNGEIQ